MKLSKYFLKTSKSVADADLIGLPYRIIVSPKTIAQASCELKKRDSQESSLVALDSIID